MDNDAKASSDDVACTLCGTTFQGPGKYKAFPLCDSCYSSAYEADMTIARSTTFEEADHICDNVWVGPEGSTRDVAWLRERGIDRVLTVAGHMHTMQHFESIEYMQLDIDDDPSEQLKHHWEGRGGAFDFMRSRDTGVLVHCVSGVSRSGATAVAYCMRFHTGGDLAAAYSMVRRKRPCVSPNSGFQRQLIEYAEALRSRQTGAVATAAAAAK